jgi:hypothetical protein
MSLQLQEIGVNRRYISVYGQHFLNYSTSVEALYRVPVKFDINVKKSFKRYVRDDYRSKTANIKMLLSLKRCHDCITLPSCLECHFIRSP